MSHLEIMVRLLLVLPSRNNGKTIVGVPSRNNGETIVGVAI